MLPRYKPMVGHGVFGSLLQSVIPFLKRKVLPTAIKSATNIASDLISGKSFGDTVKRRGVQALKEIVTPATGARKRRAPASNNTANRSKKRRRRRNALGI